MEKNKSQTDALDREADPGAEQEMLLNAKKFRALVENNDAIIALVDENLNSFYRSSSAARITGWSHAEFAKIAAAGYIHPDDILQVQAVHEEAKANPGKTIPLTARFRHKAGHWLWLEGTVTNMLNDPDIKGIITNMRDITERKEAEEKIDKIKRLYYFISQVNQRIVRTTDETTLFKEACSIAVEFGKFRMAWIGKIDEKTQSMTPVMHAGEENGYLSVIKTISLADVPEASLPIVTALLEGSYFTCNDIENDPVMLQWKSEALSRGYLSLICLPVKRSGKLVSVFTLYADTTNFFNEEEIVLLEEATGDIAFALENFEKDEMRQKAEAEIIKERNLSDSIINSLPGIFYLYTKEGKFLRWNTNFETVTGYTGEEIRQMNPLDFFDEPEKPLLAQKINNTFLLGQESVQAGLFLKTKEKIPYYFTGKAVEYQGQPCLLGVGIDFTDRVTAQEKIKETTEQLRMLTAHLQHVREEERKRIGREIHDELGQQLTAIKMDVAWLDRKVPEKETLFKTKLKNIIDMLDSSNLSIRRILSELRPGILDDYGLLEAIDWLGSQFTSNTGIPFKFTTTENKIQSSEPVVTCIFRVYQEALTNITRHANATSVVSSLTINDGVIIVDIKDNGKGFDPALVQTHRSFGILGMKERVISLGGVFELNAVASEGTSILVKLPLTIAEKK